MTKFLIPLITLIGPGCSAELGTSTEETTKNEMIIELVYTSSRGESLDLYKNSLDGLSEKQLTRNNGSEWHARYVAAKEIIVYNAQDNNQQLFILSMDVSGKSVNYNIPDFPNFDVSKNGEKIAFTRKGEDGNQIVYASVENPSDSIKITNHKYYHKKPKWSPDGASIAYLSDRDQVSEIYIYSIATKTSTRVTDSQFKKNHITWSPDGEKIAFTMNEKEQTNDIFILNLNNYEIDRLTETSVDENDITWSPVHNIIAYQGKVHNEDHIFTIDIATKIIKQISSSPGFHAEPCWVYY